jgi:hypothetical protein
VALPSPGAAAPRCFESLVIAWLREASQSGVAELLSLSWDEAHTRHPPERAVRRAVSVINRISAPPSTSTAAASTSIRETATH